jgi:HAD superfamily hydrolase (TIGR01509 family)
MKGVLIDLDLTLVASQEAEPLRRARSWPDVYAMIPRLQPYEGVSDLITELASRRIAVCVVTSSPGPYCSRVLKHWKWAGIKTVCFYDTKRRKPYPDPILLGLERLGIKAEDAISVGDEPKDIQASKAAGVYSVGALWGTLDKEALRRAQPDALCETVDELRTLILSRIKGE